MSSTTKKTSKPKTSAKTTTRATSANADKTSEAAIKAAAAKSSEASLKAAAAKSSEASLKASSAKEEAAGRANAVKAPAAKGANPTLVGKPQSVVLGPVMRKKELIETVVTRTGLKKKDAKPVIEGMLAVLGEALAEGRELILPPLGKVLVRKEKQLPNGKVMVVKVRQSTPAIPTDPKPFSDAAE